MPKGRARRCGTCPRKRHKKLRASTPSQAHGRPTVHGKAFAFSHRPHLVEDRVTTLLLVSATQRCSGQRCTATFVVRFQGPLPSNATILASPRSDVRIPEGPA